MSGILSADTALARDKQPRLYDTGIPSERPIRVVFPALLTVAGAAGHGKTSVARALALNIALVDSLRVAFLCEPDKQYAIASSAAQAFRYGRANEDREQLYAAARDWVGHRIGLLDYPRGEQPSADWLIEQADAAGAAGYRILVVDPWEQVVIPRRPDETITEVIGNTLGRLRAMAVKHGMLVVVCTHLTLDGERAPTILDICDSQQFARRSDQVLIVWRPDMHVNCAGIEACKCPIEMGGAVRSVPRQWCSIHTGRDAFRLEACPDPFKHVLPRHDDYTIPFAG